MKVYIVHFDGVIYGAFSTRARAENYVKEVWVEHVQPMIRIQEEKVDQ
jgi:hypothetical protein